MEIRVADFADPQLLLLIRLHLASMKTNSPPEHVHALDLSGSMAPNVAVFAAWRGAALAGMGALKAIDADSGEIKSMRTHPDHLRYGVGAALLERLITLARERRYRRLSLETGRGEAFEPALALYRTRGFRDGPPFAGYEANAFSQFLHLDLT
jgi:putative acetyltransferase